MQPNSTTGLQAPRTAKLMSDYSSGDRIWNFQLVNTCVKPIGRFPASRWIGSMDPRFLGSKNMSNNSITRGKWQTGTVSCLQGKERLDCSAAGVPMVSTDGRCRMLSAMIHDGVRP